MTTIIAALVLLDMCLGMALALRCAKDPEGEE